MEGGQQNYGGKDKSSKSTQSHWKRSGSGSGCTRMGDADDMNHTQEDVAAAFVALAWIITGTLTYWLICDADDCADGHDDNAGTR